MNNLFFVLTVSVISLALSRADKIDKSFQCRITYEFNAATKGEVTSPLYYQRDTYHNDLWCDYIIKAPEGNRIKISFKALDITPSRSCSKDMLAVFSKDKKKVLGRFCGTEIPRPLLSLPGESEIRLFFKTDFMASGKGFVLMYESRPNMEICETGFFECENGNCYDPKKRCDGEDDCGDGTDEEYCNDKSFQCRMPYEFNAAIKGEVTSPFYYQRDTYHDGLSGCEYRIRAPEGNRVKISFEVFDIANVGDSLTVCSKDKKTVFGVFSGTQIPRPIVSLPGENEIILMFGTDLMVSGKGFVLTYESGPNLELCDNGLKECKNRNCYDPKKKCDGTDDCGDGTDEEDCGFPLIVEPEICGTQIFEPKSASSTTSPDRIVGGDVAIPNSWPWQVSFQKSLYEPNAHFCGGTLINAQWVVTAAHCVPGFPILEASKIVLGSHSKYKRTKYEHIRYGTKLFFYPDLEEKKLQKFLHSNDIAVIKLNAPVTFSDGVRPACLPSAGLTAKPGWYCYGTGWGATRGSGGADVLKQEQIFVRPPEDCGIHGQPVICTKKDGMGACFGDSGGPLQCNLKGKWFLSGVTSYIQGRRYGDSCTLPGANAGYADVAAKADWIKTLINKYS